MITLINILYGIILLSYILISVFIVYHLAKYTIHSSLNYAALIIFIVISIPLIISNIILFSLVDWTGIINSLPI